MNHPRWKTAPNRAPAARHHEDSETKTIRAEIKPALDLDQPVHDRRTVLKISQSELARRAKALDASLNITTDDDHAVARFLVHTA